MNRFKELDTLSLSEIEVEIETLVSIVGDTPSDSEIKYINGLMVMANALGSTRGW
jgi:hypothetical protein